MTKISQEVVEPNPQTPGLSQCLQVAGVTARSCSLILISHHGSGSSGSLTVS
jgi:hypothetical protein